LAQLLAPVAAQSAELGLVEAPGGVTLDGRPRRGARVRRQGVQQRAPSRWS